MKPSINWKILSFDQLSPSELYAIMQLRNEVFVVEQNCVYQDADNKDQAAYHCSGLLNEKLVAYARILPKGISYSDYVSIGRVVSSPSLRGTGIGKELMLYTMKQVNTLFGTVPIKIGAQLYLKKFYTALGFLPTSEVYFEDGIEHIEMIKTPATS